MQTETEYLNLKRRIKATAPAVIGERIKAARTELGLSHDRLGEHVGTSRHHLIRLEKGNHHPGPSMLTAIAKATGREVEFFLGGENTGDSDDAKEGDRRAA